jgi:site-specific DNA-methyltransferase (adenine-specific)
MPRKPGEVRDAILGYLEKRQGDVSVAEIRKAVESKIGKVAPSSVRSYLQLNPGDVFVRTGRGRYRLRGK